MIAQLKQKPTINNEKRIRRYGENFINSILSEYGHIDNIKTFDPQDPKKLTQENKKEILNLLTMER